MKKVSWFNHILSINREYKPRNYLKIVSFTLLNMNRGNWKWFRLETILYNIDMNRGNWKWFRLETILNNIDMKKVSESDLTYILSLNNREYKH